MCQNFGGLFNYFQGYFTTKRVLHLSLYSAHFCLLLLCRFYTCSHCVITMQTFVGQSGDKLHVDSGLALYRGRATCMAHLPSVRSNSLQFGSGSRSRHCMKAMHNSYGVVELQCIAHVESWTASCMVYTDTCIYWLTIWCIRHISFSLQAKTVKHVWHHCYNVIQLCFFL